MNFGSFHHFVIELDFKVRPFLLTCLSNCATETLHFPAKTWKMTDTHGLAKRSESKMRLITNDDNVDALKIIIAANEAKTTLAIEKGSNLVPCLIDDENEAKFFSVNAACLYLHEKPNLLKKKAIGAVEGLLHWEMKVLRPLLVTYHSTKKNADEIKNALKSRILPILDQSEDQLTHYPQVKEIVSANDIVIWCDLYPIWKEAPEIIQALPRVQQWMAYLAAKPTFQSGLDTIIVSKGKKIKWNFASWLKKVSDMKSSNVDQEVNSACDVSKEPPVSEKELEETLKAWNTPLKIKKSTNTTDGKVLPKPGQRNVLVTSALPYVNNVPHLGNIVGAILSADVFARFCRLRQYNTLFICGTDEYGTSTETKALEEGLSCQEICDKYHKLHSEIYQWFDIGFDHFGRTTTAKQTAIAQDIFWQLHKSGNLIEDAMDQLHCEKCDRFLADRFVEGICPFCGYEDARGDQCDSCGKLINATELKEPRCKLCSCRPQVKTSKHIFIDLPKVEEKLNGWLEATSVNWTNNARVIAKSWLKGGLQPRCITRDLKWGTPVPMKGYESKVFYVWFDAPIGYISITANYTDQWEKWWKNPSQVEYYEFMAKDNVPFHSVVFPATQLGTESPWTMVNYLMSTEYLNYEDAKFSKSRGIGVFGNDARDTEIPADIWRFYLMYTRPENADSAFKWEDLMLKNNSELLANLGNFVNRALKFTKDNFGGKIGEVGSPNVIEGDQLVMVQINQCLKQYVELLEKCREREAISQIFNISRIGNQLMQAEKPWKLVKTKVVEDFVRAHSVVSLCANISCLLAVLIQPFMPNMSRVLLDQLNISLDKVNILAESDPKLRLFR